MRHNIKNMLAMAVAALSATSAFAQNLNTGYFTDGYLYRHDLNPAFGSEQSYMSFPALGNIGVGMNGNVSVTDFLYNVNGRTTTFLNPNVSAEEFLSNINDKNKVFSDIKLSLLSVGFKGMGGYNTVGINVRSNFGVTIPGSLFQLAKQGIENKTYDINDFNARATAYAEIALGHSRDINEHLRVGANLKVLLGVGNVEAKLNKAQLALGDNEWTATTNAEVNASVKGFQYKTETTMRGAEGHETPHTYVNDMDIDGAGLNGFGLAVDLGAEYKLNDDWRFSAALLDLGFINWSNNMVASTNGDRYFTTDKYIFNIDDNADNCFENEMDRLAEGVSTLYELQDMGDQGGRTTMLGATMRFGAEYTLPVYNKVTFGLMNTTRLHGEYSWTDFRLSTNYAPADLFSMGLSLGAGTYGMSFGWIINLHPKGFNLYAGMDRMLGKLSKDGIPLNPNINFNMGVNFPF